MSCDLKATNESVRSWEKISSYYTLYSLSVFSLAESLQLTLEISATYRLVGYLLADNWLICRLRVQCMISNKKVSVLVLSAKPADNTYLALD